MSKKKIQKPRNLATVITSTTEILQAFGAAVTAFNNLNAAGGVDEFMTLLDPGVLLETINGAVVYRGKPEVRDYLVDHLAPSKPVFIPTTTPVTQGVTDWFGYVKGTANWSDTDNDSDDTGVSMGYCFGFAKNPSGNWLLLIVRSSRPYTNATSISLE